MAASTVFIVYDTAGVPIAAIQPNTLNGPGGVQQSSDLSMFGLGYAFWGQASDQNDYRLLENFACPQSVLNPTPVQPMGAAELGPGNGINAPIAGQLWFNTTANAGQVAMYVYNGTVWSTVASPVLVVKSGTVNTIGTPTTDQIGTLYFSTGINQLLISNGSNYESVAANYLPLAGGTMTGAFSMGNNQIHNLQPPTAPYDAANKQYVDTVAGGSGAGVFVPLAGGTMTGGLVMQSTGITLNSGSIVANSGNITVNGGTMIVTSPASGIAFNAGAGRVTNLSDTLSALTDAVNANVGDGRWLNKTNGGTVTGSTTFSSPVTIPLTPTVSTQAASKGYVDSSLLSGFTQNFYASATYSTWTYSGSAWNGTGSVGYCKLPNGLIFQWGVTPPSTGIVEGGTTVTLPVPMTILSVSSTLMVNTSGPNTQDQAGQCYFQPNVLSTTITLYLQYMSGGSAGGGIRLSWIAIGH